MTTDKVYENKEWEYGYRENDPLDGYDPYSNSKSCSELVTHSYKQSFFTDGRCAVSTCRAGNVIGGGDFAADRIVPDCVRAAEKKEPIIVRNPHSTRPFQHVLEPLFLYLTVAKAQWENAATTSDRMTVTASIQDVWRICSVKHGVTGCIGSTAMTEVRMRRIF